MARIFRLPIRQYLESHLGALGKLPPPMQVAVHTIPGGDKGTKATLEKMREIVIDSLKDRKHGAFLRGLAIKIASECKTKDFKCEARAIDTWVRQNVKWIRDTRGFETLQYPYRTLAFGGGDCDDLCCAPMTCVWVKVDGRLGRTTLKELYKHFVPISSRKLVMAGTHTVDHVDDEEFLRPAENTSVEVLSIRGKGHKEAKPIWRRVTRMYHKTAPVELLKVRISGGHEIVCTPNHKLYRDNSSRFVPVRAGDLSVGDGVVSVHDMPEYSEFPSLLSDEDLFMLGFWIADGCYEHKHGPKFACGKDEELAKRVQAWAATRRNNWDKPIGASVSGKGDVAVCSRALMAWMKELGFEGTSATKRIPGWVFELPDQQLRHFIGGYFKGDGSIYTCKTKGSTEVNACSVNRDLLCDILDLLNRFGIEGVIGKLDTRDSNGKPCSAHRLTICSKPMVEKFIEKIGNFRNAEVILPGGSRMNYPVSTRTVRSIETVREHEIFDLEVEPDRPIIIDPECEHIFVANGFLTHNTILLCALATSIGIKCAFKAIAANPQNKGQYSHVYAVLDPFGNDKWIAADPTVKTAAFGWESPLKYKEMLLEI